MPIKIAKLFLFLAAVPLFTSCNIYAPLASPTTDAELIQEAQSRLHAGDYAGAAVYYARLSNTALRSEKLCTVDLAQAGLDLSTLLSVVTNGSSGAGLLGGLANALLPYSDAKAAAALLSITDCAGMTPGDSASLLRSLSYIVDCSIRIAHTDTSIATSNGSDVTCNSSIAGNGDGEITSADIGGNAGTGDLSVGEPGMCSADIKSCLDNMQAVSGLGSDLADAGLSDLVDNLNQLEATFPGFLSGGVVTKQGRIYIRDSID